MTDMIRLPSGTLYLTRPILVLSQGGNAIVSPTDRTGSQEFDGDAEPPAESRSRDIFPD